ncbi:arabinogalactan endo-1,4-beta-galactosidase [Coprinopsis marcescibilis]|uniref:Arabinogalactan endo-beta-1,4-galactanase n=1 Tax=Coprinopsis marcescibilis TaxID=230819 RepID=A0A5C3L0W6_COPMA|nr:arabinogalactan endo-1,4-beta-galactosidase [Coprinopsis marcescibilis]
MWAPFSLLLGLSAIVSSVGAIQYRGADFSSLVNLENQGTRYKENGNTLPLERILANNGANLARIRIWATGNYTAYSIPYALNLAKRAQAVGMDIYVNLHYSDAWADPGKQWIPSAWPKDLSGLNNQIYTYTRDVVLQFQNQGTPIKYLEIGNEINDGMLWPVGRISQNGYGPLSELLHSAAAGTRAASSSVRIMVHLANGWNNAAVTSFFNNVFLPGKLTTSDVDVLGFSFYPFYGTSATLNNLRTSLTNIANRLAKEVMVVEVNWPFSCPNVNLSEPRHPTGNDGQVSFFNNVKNIVEALPNGRGTGIVYWEPAWIGNAGLGSACLDNLIVDNSGNVRPSS